VGVSACLLGEPVRHDGAHKRDAWLVEVLGAQVDWVAVCPEVEAGFGTPREPVQLERTADGGVAMMTVSTRRDMTATMERYTRRRVDELVHEHLDGYVFKAESPSCDPDTGLFARAVAVRLPDLPVIDEDRLSDPTARDMFVEQVFAHHRARRSAARSGPQVRTTPVVRVSGGEQVAKTDRAAIEEPLEIRLHTRPFAVIMRTPGNDRELAAGFLLAERVIRSGDDLGTIAHCTSSNVLNVTLTDEAAASLDQLLAGRRNVTTNSSCGLCGRQTIDSLASDAPPIRAPMTVASRVIVSLPGKLRETQAVFDETGGLHGAGLFAADGTLVDSAEDVGRHNAVDKVVGRMLLRERLPLVDHVLCVSGRTSFEIVQKALFAGIPVVAAVSAPSSLAIDLAEAFGITLVGFVRGDSFNIYAHPERIG